MRKLSIALLIAILAASCFSMLLSQTFAQEETAPQTTAPPLIVRWMRFRGAVTQWGDDCYHGSITVNTKTANAPAYVFKPWSSVTAIWSNESRLISADTKPVGEVTYTHYTARLVRLIAVRGRTVTLNLNITGIWNVNKVKITSEFDESGVLIKTAREVTPIVTRAMGQLHITEGWKKFDLEIEGMAVLKGIGVGMTTTTRMINPFSYGGGFRATFQDLCQLMRCFRAMPGFGNYNSELDYNSDSKIDLADLTTVAANM